MSRRSLALSAYLALSRTQDGPRSEDDIPTRPAGQLVWMHAETARDATALAALAQRLLQPNPDLSFLWTGHAPRDARLASGLPEETISATQAFLAHWRPDLMVWSGQSLRPALMEAAHEAHLPCLMVNADEASFTTPAPRWMPDMTAAALMRFDVVFCTSREAERKLRRYGLEGHQIVRAGILNDAPPPLDCAPELHEEVAASIGGRPIWLAARLPAAETRMVLDAHVAAGRLAPRLLLVIVLGHDGRCGCRLGCGRCNRSQDMFLGCGRDARRADATRAVRRAR